MIDRLPVAEERSLDLPTLLATLQRHGVSFVIVGGIAGTAHGSTTITTDLDICYELSQPNVRALERALRELGAVLHVGGTPVSQVIDHRALARGDFFTFITDAGELDCLALPDGTGGYDELVRNASEIDYAGVRVPITSLDDLIRMKEAAGRPKDLVELAILLALRDEVEARKGE